MIKVTIGIDNMKKKNAPYKSDVAGAEFQLIENGKMRLEEQQIVHCNYTFK